jgi:hypothetical protein
MSKPVDPNYKELMLTICIVMPFMLLLGMAQVEKGDVWAALFVDAFVYAVARSVFRRRSGHWRW